MEERSVINHSSRFTPFINDEIREPCLMCCKKKRCGHDEYGNRCCIECGEAQPKSFNMSLEVKREGEKAIVWLLL